MMDANTRVGAITNDSIGGVNPTAENDNGTCLRSALETANLAAYNTFVGKGEGTWVDTYRHEHRIDFVCGPKHLVSKVAAVKIVEEIDLATATKDHSVLVAQIDVRHEEVQRITEVPTRDPEIFRQDLGHEEKVMRFHRKLKILRWMRVHPRKSRLAV